MPKIVKDPKLFDHEAKISQKAQELHSLLRKYDKWHRISKKEWIPRDPKREIQLVQEIAKAFDALIPYLSQETLKLKGISSSPWRTASIANQHGFYIELKDRHSYYPDQKDSLETTIWSLLHELLHWYRRDFFLFLPDRLKKNFYRESWDLVMNVAADILINRVLAKILHPDPLWEKISSLFVSPVFFLLLPPEFYLGRGLQANDIEKLLNIFKKRWKAISTTIHGEFPPIYNALSPRQRRKFLEELVEIYYLGYGVETGIYPLFFRLLKLWDKWGIRFDCLLHFDGLCMDKYFGHFYGHGRETIPLQIERDFSFQKTHKLIEAIKSALTEDKKESLLLEMGDSVTPVPYFSRKDLFWLTAGIAPTLYKGKNIENRPVEKKSVVYLDVSGSFFRSLPQIYYALYRLRHLLHDPLFVFSSVVEALPLNQLKFFEADTTGGTDFHEVALHAKKHKFQKALIVSDGWGNLDPQLAKEVKERCKFYLLLLGDIEFAIEKKDSADSLFALLDPRPIKNQNYWLLLEHE